MLQWDGTGLCVYAKRLERGRFACLWREDGDPPIALSISELDLFLDGSVLVGKIRFRHLRSPTFRFAGSGELQHVREHLVMGALAAAPEQ